MATLYRKTEWFRHTLQAAGSTIYKVPSDAPEGAHCKVTLCIRETPEIELALDVEAESGASRDSYWPAPPLNKTLCIALRPGQSLVGRSTTGVHELSVICEFWRP